MACEIVNFCLLVSLPSPSVSLHFPPTPPCSCPATVAVVHVVLCCCCCCFWLYALLRIYSAVNKSQPHAASVFGFPPSTWRGDLAASLTGYSVRQLLLVQVAYSQGRLNLNLQVGSGSFPSAKLIPGSTTACLRSLAPC